MIGLLKSVVFPARIATNKIFAECVYQRHYSCLCATNNFKATIIRKSQKQQILGAVCHGVNYLAPSYTVQYSSKPEDQVLVYHGNLTPQIRMVKIFSLCSSIAGLASQPILYNHASDLGGTGVLIAVGSFVGFFTFVTPLLLHILTRKYVTDIHFNGATGVYTATLLTFFLRVKQISFKSEEVKVPDVPGLFTSFTVKNTDLFIDPRQFDDPSHYGKLMGYGKPIDFLKLNKTENETDKTSVKNK